MKMFKVKDLIETLKNECDPEDVVIISRDPEGNGFATLEGVSVEEFAFDLSESWAGGRRGEIIERTDADDDDPKCIVIWPN